MSAAERVPVPTAPAVALQAVSRQFRSRAGRTAVLREVTLDFPAGEMTAVMGPSGSGKSTLLQCAAGLDRPTSGRVLLGDVELSGVGERELSRIHRERIGFVFQSFNLLPMLGAADNVALPLRLAGRRPSRALVATALAQVGLAGLERRRPAELSGGQQQRVAVARALVVRPEVVFADEPTGALDTSTAVQVLDLLRDVVDRAGPTVVLVTHDPLAAARADRVVFLVDGRIRARLERPTVERVAGMLADLESPCSR